MKLLDSTIIENRDDVEVHVSISRRDLSIMHNALYYLAPADNNHMLPGVKQKIIDDDLDIERLISELAGIYEKTK